MRSFLFTTLVAMVALCSAKHCTITWEDCGTSANMAKITGVTWSPQNPQPGDNVTIMASGTLKEEVQKSTATIVLAGGLVKKTWNTCIGTEVDAPFNYAKIYFPAQVCPMPIGPIAVNTPPWLFRTYFIFVSIFMGINNQIDKYILNNIYAARSSCERKTNIIDSSRQNDLPGCHQSCPTEKSHRATRRMMRTTSRSFA